jgi:hypothetical protein
MSMPPGATWRYGEPEFDARQRRLMERVRVAS